jgi:trigger factor
VMIVSSLASCTGGSKNDKESEDEVYALLDYENVDLSKYITIGSYKGLTFELDKIEVTDTELTTTIDTLLKENNVCEKITDRPAQKGDKVVVDYSGYIDGKQFSGGTATNKTIDIIDDSGYIDGFAEGIIGHTPGEEFSVWVRFPDDYGKVDYAGKDAEFKFKLYYIVEYKVTDDFANTYSGGKCTSADDFAAYLKESIITAKRDEAVHSAIWNNVMSTTTVKEYPQESMDYYLYLLKLRCESIAAQLGATYEVTLAYLGITEETLLGYAKNYTKEDLVLYQIAKLENYIPTDADIDSFAIYYAENNFSTLNNEMLSDGYTQDAVTLESAAEYAKENHAKYIRLECMRAKVYAFLLSNNTFTEK